MIYSSRSSFCNLSWVVDNWTKPYSNIKFRNFCNFFEKRLFEFKVMESFRILMFQKSIRSFKILKSAFEGIETVDQTGFSKFLILIPLIAVLHFYVNV